MKNILFLIFITLSANIYSFQASNEARELADLAYATHPNELIKFPHQKRHQLKILKDEITHLRRGGIPFNIKLITDDVTLRGALEIVQKRERAIHKPMPQNLQPVLPVQVVQPPQPIERTQKIP